MFLLYPRAIYRGSILQESQMALLRFFKDETIQSRNVIAYYAFIILVFLDLMFYVFILRNIHSILNL